MRGCDHQSIPLLFLKLRGRDECERWKERDRQTDRTMDRQMGGFEVGGAREHFSVEVEEKMYTSTGRKRGGQRDTVAERGGSE